MVLLLSLFYVVKFLYPTIFTTTSWIIQKTFIGSVAQISDFTDSYHFDQSKLKKAYFIIWTTKLYKLILVAYIIINLTYSSNILLYFRRMVLFHTGFLPMFINTVYVFIYLFCNFNFSFINLLQHLLA